MIDQDPLRSERSNSQFEALMFEGTVAEKTYQNLGTLLSRVFVLCASTFYFGYCLTYLSTFTDSVNAEVPHQLG